MTLSANRGPALKYQFEIPTWIKATNELENVQCIYMQYKWYDQYVADLGINYIKL